MDGDNEKDHEALDDRNCNVLLLLSSTSKFLSVLRLNIFLFLEVVENCLNAFECFVLRSSKEA